MHHADHDDRRYVLVHPVDAKRLTYNIVGYKLGRECKNDKWWKTHRKDGSPLRHPAFFVPQSELTKL